MENPPKDRNPRFSFRKSKPGPPASGTDSPVDPGLATSPPSVGSLAIQQPVATKGKSLLGRVWGRSRPPSPLPVISLDTTAAPLRTPDLGLAVAPNPTPVPGPPSGTSATLTLWQTALAKLAPEDRVGENLNAGSLLDNLITTIKTKQREIEANRWVYTDTDGTRVAYGDTFLTLLNKYAGVVDIAIQHDPQVVALVWAGFRFLLQIATADMQNVKLIFASLEGLVRILFRCDIHEKLYAGRGLQAAKQLDTSMVELYVAILTYLCSAKRQLWRQTGVRMVRGIASESGQLFKDVLACEVEMQKDADLAEKEAAALQNYAQEERTRELKTMLAGIVDPIQDIVRTIVMINQSVDEAKRAKILMWLSDIPIEDHHIFSRERRHEETGNWLLQHVKFCEWRDSDSSSMLWLRGAAGAGKTILASKVIDEFKSQMHTSQDALAFFYCNYRDAARRDPASILRALVKQLCLYSSRTQLPWPVVSLYKTREINGHQSGAPHPIESRDLIVKLSNGFLRTTIVIDALDECDRETRDHLVGVLKEIINSTQTVRIFVTGRSDGDLRKILSSFPSHYIEAFDNQGDIATYIDSEINRCCREKLLLDGDIDDDLKSDIVAQLMKGADGMFLWVYLQFAEICRGRTPAGIRLALRTLPKALDDTYLLILNRIADTETAETVCVVNTVLKWTHCVQSRCSIELINSVLAVGVPASDRYYWKQAAILDICQNLVVFDVSLETFRFAHYSVQEFFVGQSGFDNAEAHAGIAQMCLAVLTGEEETTDPVLLSYCTLAWAAHVRLSGDGNHELERRWKLFLQPSPKYAEWYSRIVLDDRHRALRRKDGVVSPLWVAYIYRLNSVFIFLLANGANGNDPNDEGETPLIHAARVGDFDFAQRMIQSGKFDLRFKTKAGSTAVQLAMAGGHRRIARILFREVPDFTQQSRIIEESTPQVVVHRQLENGAEQDSGDINGETLLNQVIRYRNYQMQRRLREVIRTPSSTHLPTE